MLAFQAPPAAVQAPVTAFRELWAAELERRIDAEAEAQALADDTRVRTNALGGLEADQIFTNVYSEQHPLVEEERRWFHAYEASFEGGAS